MSRPALGPTQPPIQWVPGALSLWVRWPWSEADHSPPTSTRWLDLMHLIHTTRDYRQYSAIAVLHTLEFTVPHALRFLVFTSRILATDLSQSRWHFKSHMKTSYHSLTHFLPLFCDCQFRILDTTTLSYCSLLLLLFKRHSLSVYDPSARTPRKTPSSIIKDASVTDQWTTFYCRRTFRGNVFTQTSPSNRSTRHSIFVTHCVLSDCAHGL
jgi:hypothetical protein